MAPANADALSNRIPIPSPERNTSILPVSGWKFFAGSSVVTRHCMAKPWGTIFSWVIPNSGNVIPSAIRIWDCTKSILKKKNIILCWSDRNYKGAWYIGRCMKFCCLNVYCNNIEPFECIIELRFSPNFSVEIFLCNNFIWSNELI